MWLGSQATKPLRYALAALLSPATDRLIDATQRRLGLSKKADAVKLLVVSIFGSTCLFCLAIITLAVARAAVVSTAAAKASAASPASSSSAALLLLGIVKRGAVGRGLGAGGSVGEGLDAGGVGGGRSAFPSLPLFAGARNRASILDREREVGAACRPRRLPPRRRGRQAARMTREGSTAPKDYHHQQQQQ